METKDTEVKNNILSSEEVIVTQTSKKNIWNKIWGQGKALSPVFFNLAHEKVIRDIREEQEMEIIGLNTLLAYLDDIVILILS